jgi:hypothetical protein
MQKNEKQRPRKGRWETRPKGRLVYFGTSLFREEKSHFVIADRLLRHLTSCKTNVKRSVLSVVGCWTYRSLWNAYGCLWNSHVIASYDWSVCDSSPSCRKRGPGLRRYGENMLTIGDKSWTLESQPQGHNSFK